MATGENAAQNTVECCRCERRFDEAYPGGHERGQGYQCACEVRDDRIRGHYGSTRHDMAIYRADAPLGLPYGASVCDDCMDELVSVGKIKLEQRGVS